MTADSAAAAADDVNGLVRRLGEDLARQAARQFCVLRPLTGEKNERLVRATLYFLPHADPHKPGFFVNGLDRFPGETDELQTRLNRCARTFALTFTDREMTPTLGDLPLTQRWHLCSALRYEFRQLML